MASLTPAIPWCGAGMALPRVFGKHICINGIISPCPVGYYKDSDTTCAPCPAGYWCQDGRLTACGVGRYQPDVGAVRCWLCPQVWRATRSPFSRRPIRGEVWARKSRKRDGATNEKPPPSGHTCIVSEVNHRTSPTPPTHFSQRAFTRAFCVARGGDGRGISREKSPQRASGDIDFAHALLCLTLGNLLHEQLFGHVRGLLSGLDVQLRARPLCPVCGHFMGRAQRPHEGQR